MDTQRDPVKYAGITLVQHSSPESVLAAYCGATDLEEVDGIGGIDAEGKEWEDSPEKVCESIRNGKFWGFADTNKAVVHVWDGGEAPEEDLLFFLGHEAGHVCEAWLEQEHVDPEEARADTYGETAVQAANLLRTLRPAADAFEAGRKAGLREARERALAEFEAHVKDGCTCSAAEDIADALEALEREEGQ